MGAAPAYTGIMCSLGQRNLSARSGLHMARPLFGCAPKDRQLERLAEDRKKLERRRPKRGVGRHLFLADLVETAKGRSGGTLSSESYRALMKKHGSLYD